MNDELILTEVKGCAAYITLNRPPLNIITIEMLETLREAVTWAFDQKKSLVVITSNGRAFSAGVDIDSHEEEVLNYANDVLREILIMLWTNEIPVIAAVDGYALGGGCELAMSADLVVASERTEIGQPEVAVGSLACFGSSILPRKISRSYAMEVLLTGKRFNADDCYRMGMVNAILPTENFAQHIEDYVAQFEKLSPLMLAKTKKSVIAGDVPDRVAGVMAIDKISREEVTPSYDAKEGMEAFFEKREPRWRGC